MAEQGLWHGAPRLAACKEVCFVLGASTDADYCAAKLAGYRFARVEPPAPTPNKTKLLQWAAGCPAPSNGPPRRNPTFPVNTHGDPPASTTGKERQAHPTESQRPFLLHLKHCRRHRVRDSGSLSNVERAVTRSPRLLLHGTALCYRDFLAFISHLPVVHSFHLLPLHDTQTAIRQA